MTWKITYEGEVCREADLTLGECEDIISLASAQARARGEEPESWDTLNPLYSPRALACVLAVYLARDGRDLSECLDEVKQRKGLELLRLVERDVDDRPEGYDVPDGKLPIPLVEASEASSTTSSSSEPSDSDGAPTSSENASDAT